jgi:hypothetical protein
VHSITDCSTPWGHTYDGIISKARVMKDQEQRIKHAIVLKKEIDDMGVV